MRRPTKRMTHRWLAVVGGVVLAAWIVTGLVMVIPDRLPYPRSQRGAIDTEAMRVSPTEAVAAAWTDSRTAPEVLAVNLVRVGSRLSYRILFRGVGSRLVDAGSGEAFDISAGLAAQLVREGFVGAPAVSGTELLQWHDWRYPRGELPIYRVTFDGERGLIAYVSSTSGDIRLSTPRTRIRALAGSVHDYSVVRFLIGSINLQRGLLIACGLLALGVVASGYLLMRSGRRKRTD